METHSTKTCTRELKLSLRLLALQAPHLPDTDLTILRKRLSVHRDGNRCKRREEKPRAASTNHSQHSDTAYQKNQWHHEATESHTKPYSSRIFASPPKDLKEPLPAGRNGASTTYSGCRRGARIPLTSFIVTLSSVGRRGSVRRRVTYSTP